MDGENKMYARKMAVLLIFMIIVLVALVIVTVMIEKAQGVTHTGEMNEYLQVFLS